MGIIMHGNKKEVVPHVRRKLMSIKDQVLVILVAVFISRMMLMD